MEHGGSFSVVEQVSFEETFAQSPAVLVHGHCGVGEILYSFYVIYIHIS